MYAPNLQRVQAAIDLATHVVTTEQHGLPDSVAAFFTALERHGGIGPGVEDRLRRMVGFRNIAVHEYEALDPEIIEATVTRCLGDLRAFSASIARRFAL
jgi:uncharacterized protein YutE (UPF0331/DUF86 family)